MPGPQFTTTNVCVQSHALPRGAGMLPHSRPALLQQHRPPLISPLRELVQARQAARTAPPPPMAEEGAEQQCDDENAPPGLSVQLDPTERRLDVDAPKRRKYDTTNRPRKKLR